MSKYKGFSKKELIDIYSKMYLSRSLDHKQLILFAVDLFNLYFAIFWSFVLGLAVKIFNCL